MALQDGIEDVKVECTKAYDEYNIEFEAYTGPTLFGPFDTSRFDNRIKAYEKHLGELTEEFLQVLIRNNSTRPLSNFVKQSTLFPETKKEKLLNELDEIEKDIAFFIKNKRLRRGM